jgi:hypothetical protein
MLDPIDFGFSGSYAGSCKEIKHLLRGMLSLEEIRNWADAIATESTLKLIKFCHTPSKRAGRTVTQIVFIESGNEYRVWIFPELNLIYVDVLHEGVEDDTKLFRGPVTRRSLESISLVLRRSQL